MSNGTLVFLWGTKGVNENIFAYRSFSPTVFLQRDHLIAGNANSYSLWAAQNFKITAGRSIELIEESKWEHEFFLPKQTRPFGFDVDRFQNP